MDADHDIPDPRFLAGVAHFNAGEFFEAHEVWEDLWMECPAAERRFVQALIQAAVAVYHFGRGNFAGARRLFESGRRYMEPYRPAYMGLDVADFWGRMEAHLAPALAGPANPAGPPPVIALGSRPRDSQ
jgi:predicted metal-dependent hydrolase